MHEPALFSFDLLCASFESRACNTQSEAIRRLNEVSLCVINHGVAKRLASLTSCTNSAR